MIKIGSYEKFYVFGEKIEDLRIVDFCGDYYGTSYITTGKFHTCFKVPKEDECKHTSLDGCILFYKQDNEK